MKPARSKTKKNRKSKVESKREVKVLILMVQAGMKPLRQVALVQYKSWR